MLRPSITKSILWFSGILLIVCLVFALGYLAYRSLPAFYASPSPQRRVEWVQLPTPLEVRSGWQTWTTANQTNGAIWTNHLVWLATEGGVVVIDESTGEQIKFLPEHGIPSVNITAISSSPNGEIWIGTRDSGIARFDGGAWAIYGEGSGLPSGRIRDLFAAPNGVIWAATANGIARFDGENWSSVRFSMFDLTRIDATAVTGLGNSIWVGSRQGVYHFDGEGWGRHGLNEGLINENVVDLTITPNGEIWAATPSGIGRFDGSRWDRFTVRDGLPDLPATHILAAPDNSVWISFADSAQPNLDQAVRFDGGTVSRVYDGGINDLVIKGGDLWVATELGLLEALNPADSRLVGQNGPLTSTFSELIETDDGIAVAGLAGVSFYAEEDDVWSTLPISGLGAVKKTDDGRLALAGTHPSDGVRLLNDDGSIEKISCHTAGVTAGKLYAISESPEGDIWLLGTEKVARYRGGQWRYFNDGLPAEFTPRKVVVDSNGEVWLGLAEGLYRFDIDREEWLLQDGRDVQRMTAGPDGSLWLIVENELLHLANNIYTRHSMPGVKGISRGFVANHDGLWISSKDGIVNLSKTGEWQLYSVAEGLSTNDVSTLTLDLTGGLWAGYGDSRFGVSHFSNGKWEIVHNIIDPELPNNGHKPNNATQRDEIVSLAITEKEQIWLGSYFGEIGRIGAEERLYQPDDYRLHFANMTAIHQAQDGTLWFIGWGGRVARLFPESMNGGVERWLIYDSRLASTTVQDVVVADGVAWLATQDGVAVLEDNECRMVAHREPLNVVRGEINPADGAIWWATSNNGGLRLNAEAESLDWPILHLRGRKFTDMIKAPDDALWFVSNQALVRLDGEDRRTQPIEGLSNVTAVAIGADLRPWVATDRGVARLGREDWEIIDTVEGIATNNLIDILVENDGTVWLLGETSISRSR